MTELNEGIDGIASLKIMLESDPDTIRDVCAMTEARFNELAGLINESLDAFTEFGGITNEAAGVLECSRINGIFVDFYHDALCTNAPYALMWVFATMMAVYVLGMTIILFRGALLPTEKIYDGRDYDRDQNDEYNNEKIDANQDRSGSGASETDDASQIQENDNKLAGTPAILYDDNEATQVRGYDFENEEGITYEKDYDGLSYDNNKR